MIVGIVINVDTYPPQISMCKFTNKLCMKEFQHVCKGQLFKKKLCKSMDIVPHKYGHTEPPQLPLTTVKTSLGVHYPWVQRGMDSIISIKTNLQFNKPPIQRASNSTSLQFNNPLIQQASHSINLISTSLKFNKPPIQRASLSTACSWRKYFKQIKRNISRNWREIFQTNLKNNSNNKIQMFECLTN